MIRAIAIIGAAALAVGVIIYSFFDCLRSDPRDVRGIRRGPWIAVILLLPVIGGILWLTLGRPRYAPSGSQPARGRGPDDDPTFLRQLEEKRRAEQADNELDEWERRRRQEKGSAAGPGMGPGDEHPQPGSDAQAPEDPGHGTDQGGAGGSDPDAEEGPTRGNRPE